MSPSNTTTGMISRDAPRLPLASDGREQESMLTQVAWFNRLRWIVGAGILVLCAVAAHALAAIEDPVPLYLLGGLTLLANYCYRSMFPRLQRSPLPVVRRHAFLQIGGDLAILTALLHFSGGVTNPLALFYSFHSFIAALVLSVRAAVVVAISSIGLLIGLGASERLGWLRHHPLDLGLVSLSGVQPLGFCLLVFAYGTTLAFSIYFVATVLDRLRENEGQLLRLGRHLALSEKLASIGTLAAGVSHEINNPIGVITGKVQVLRYRVKDGDPAEKLLADLDVIEKHARRIVSITAGLLQFSREAPFELRPVDVAALLREAADLVRVPYRAANVDLDVASAPLPAGAVVLGSSNHLLQVLINILLNAKDASPPNSRVALSSSLSSTELVLEIVDHGVGIPAEHLGKIFDPFFTTKDVDKGTGLGLAISHGIVERHRGRIEVDSEPGKGTAFRVILPVQPALI
jgi:signal transduction histidine kinase